jgi:beta-aspartyl-peptidase (threonine type)
LFLDHVDDLDSESVAGGDGSTFSEWEYTFGMVEVKFPIFQLRWAKLCLLEEGGAEGAAFEIAPRHTCYPIESFSEEFFLLTDPVLVVHGGAWAMPDDMVEAHLRGVRNALAAGWRVLDAGGAALDAVEEAVVIMEDDETFDAGRGSFLNRDGKVQLDALIMDGATLRAGGVGCVERVRNPVRAARKILSESPHVYFVGEGAERFAAEHGVALCANEELIIPREVERLREYQKQQVTGDAKDGNDLFAPEISHDTVGAVALDRVGNIGAATSTGGTLNKAPGRLGDSSLIGCGCYADNLSAAVSTTGWGEPIMKLVLAKWTADRVLAGNLPEWAAQEAINSLQQRLNGHGGIIVLNAAGQFGIAHNTPRMAWASRTVHKEESGIERGAA